MCDLRPQLGHLSITQILWRNCKNTEQFLSVSVHTELSRATASFRGHYQEGVCVCVGLSPAASLGIIMHVSDFLGILSIFMHVSLGIFMHVHLGIFVQFYACVFRPFYACVQSNFRHFYACVFRNVYACV